MLSTIQISVTLGTKTIKKLDMVRGLVKRSTKIDAILLEFLDKKDSATKPSQEGPNQETSQRKEFLE